MSKKIFTGLNYFFLVLFLLGAAVQYNDPDSFVWILIYLCGAAGCIFYMKKKSHWQFQALTAAACIVWAGFLYPDVMAADQFTVIFDEIEMKNIAIEQTREMLGLLIIAFWMIVLVISALLNSRKSKKFAGASI
jgi:hypothetical protein